MDIAQKKFWLIVAVAFIIRGLSIVTIGHDTRYALTPDSGGYLKPAQTLARHHIFSSDQQPPFTPETLRTPGYPLYLSFLFQNDSPHMGAIQWGQALMGAFTAGIVYFTSLLLWNRPRAALAAGLGLAFDFVTIIHTHFILAETFFVLVWTMAFLLMAKSLQEKPKAWMWLAAAGLTFGLAALVRPIGLYYFLMAIPILSWLGKKNIKKTMAHIVIFTLAATTLPLCWMTRNHVKAGTWSFSSIQGLNMHLARATLLEMHLTGANYTLALENIQKRFENDHHLKIDEKTDGAELGKAAIQFIAHHPIAYMEVLTKETIKLFAGNSMKVAAWVYLKDDGYAPETFQFHSSEYLRTEFKKLARSHPTLGGGVVMYLLLLMSLYALTVVGFGVAWEKNEGTKAFLALSPALYIVLITIGAGAHARYRIPAMPALFILAGLGFDQILSHKQKHQGDLST